MANAPSIPHRVAWGAQGAPADPRARILQAAGQCVARYGVERTSLALISRQAGVSRQTIYKYFSNKEEIVVEAVRQEATNATERILAVARENTTASGFMVEVAVSAHFEFTQNPTISPFFNERDRIDFRERLLRPETIEMVKNFMHPIVEYSPETEPRLATMAETFLRFHLSLLTYESGVTESPEKLREYLWQTLVPALGLPPKE